MIYTLTTNPAVDMMITTDALQPNTVMRTQNTVYAPQGKGVNVSLTLRHFGVENTALGFFGGFTGEYIVNSCRERGVAVKPIWVEDMTRINVVVNGGGQEYNLVNAGPVVPREKQEELLALLNTASDMEVLCISGSLPRGIEPSYYEEILRVCESRGISVVLDISSPKLKELLAFRPLLIKPNDDELFSVFGLRCESEEEILAALAELHRLGAQNVLLTLGARGAYFSNGTAVYRCGVYPVQVCSTVCAGDATLGGFLSGWLADKMAVEAALRLGAACGASAAENADLGDFRHVPVYRELIPVTRVK